jgi:hypothetical protein
MYDQSLRHEVLGLQYQYVWRHGRDLSFWTRAVYLNY